MSIHQLPPRDLSHAEKLVAEFKRNMSALLEYQAMRAKLQRAHYLALITEGFTREQALELTKADK